MSDPKQKRVQRFGPELWEVRGGHDWSLWDLWTPADSPSV